MAKEPKQIRVVGEFVVPEASDRQPANPPGYSYTSSSVYEQWDKAKKKAEGCRTAVTTAVVKKGKHAGKVVKKTINIDPRPQCQVFSPPCKQSRATCPVQLIWVNGQPNLRFCGQTNRRAPSVPVSSPAQANDLARSLCSCWNNGKDFAQCAMPEGAVLRGLGGISRKQLARGTRVEHEHTRGRFKSAKLSRAVARAIAQDHLHEIPDYYTRLDRMERQAKRSRRR